MRGQVASLDLSVGVCQFRSIAQRNAGKQLRTIRRLAWQKQNNHVHTPELTGWDSHEGETVPASETCERISVWAEEVNPNGFENQRTGHRTSGMQLSNEATDSHLSSTRTGACLTVVVAGGRDSGSFPVSQLVRGAAASKVGSVRRVEACIESRVMGRGLVRSE